MKRGWSLLIFTCIHCHEERMISIDFHMYTLSWREDDLCWFSLVYVVMKRGWSLLIFTCIRCHEERRISIDFTCICRHKERMISIDFHLYTLPWREEDLYWFSHVYVVMKRGWSLLISHVYDVMKRGWYSLIFTCIRCHEERVISIDFHLYTFS